MHVLAGDRGQIGCWRGELALPLGVDGARAVHARFDEAARALLALSPTTATALELLRHRLRVVRGRTILECLGRVEEPSARAALEQGAPHALHYIVGE